MSPGPWWEELSTFLSMQDVRIAAFLESILEGVSWPGGGRPIPNSRWHEVSVPAGANILATVSHPSPGPGLFLVVTQAVFTMANNTGAVPALRAGLVTDADGGRLFGGILAVPAVIGSSQVLHSGVPLSAPSDRAVTAAFGSAGGVGVHEAVALSGYIAEVPD